MYPTVLVKLFTFINFVEIFSQITHFIVAVDESLVLDATGRTVMISFVLTVNLHPRRGEQHL